MAGAKTPDSVQLESMGSLFLRIADFSTTNIDDGDTYASNVASIVGVWFNASKDVTQGGEGMNISVSGSDLTFISPEDDVTGTLYIISRG